MQCHSIYSAVRPADRAYGYPTPTPFTLQRAICERFPPGREWRARLRWLAEVLKRRPCAPCGNAIARGNSRDMEWNVNPRGLP